MIPLCRSEDLVDGGRGVRFEVFFRGEVVPAFAVRHRGIAYAYLNRCAHVWTQLDWQPGDFFEPDAEFLICATHGALYDPATGACRGGLRQIQLLEHDRIVSWLPDAQAVPLPDAPQALG